MKNIYTALLLFISLSLFSQDEKRLALVIGNANYEKGELKNPVNDARLIASSLDSLGFDVILKENIETQNDFKLAILEFGKKRPNYDVAFVYYAGHGIQISNENYLLPTKQDFTSEDEVELFGVSVQDILKYLRSQTDQVNILILDACRDNPFENNWNKTRSIAGQGLAKIPPPTGSLIAFSTDSGQTAPDGDGENSIYTISLAKNMLLEQTTIDQVFRNVRSEILSLSNGEQRPVEATQLTGEAFYLNPSDFKEDLKKVEDILDQENGDYVGGLAIIERVLSKNNLVNAQILKGRLLTEMGNYEKAQIEFENLLLRDSLNIDTYIHYATIFEEEKKFEKAIEIYNKAIELDPENDILYYYRTIPYEELEMYEEAELDYLKAIEINPLDIDYLYNLGKLYDDKLKENPEKALKIYNKILEFNSEQSSILNMIGSIYINFYKDDVKAEEYFLKAIGKDSLFAKGYYNLGIINHNKEEYQNSIKYYSKAVELKPNESDYYYELARSYLENGNVNKAEENLLKAIELNSKVQDYYIELADLNSKYYNQPEKAIAYYLKILDFDPTNKAALNNIGTVYQNTIKNNEKALEYYLKSIEFDPLFSLGFFNIGKIYGNLEEYNKSIQYHSKAIKIEPENASYYYYRAESFLALELYDKAEEDYLKAIEINPLYTASYNQLGNLYDKINNQEKAIEYYLKILDYDSNNTIALDNIGATYHFSLNNYKKAEEYYLKALQLDSLDVFSLENLGVVYSEIEEYDKSIKYLSKAIELDPENDILYYERTTPYEELELYKKAELDYLKAIEINPEDTDYYLFLGNLYKDELNFPEGAISQYMKIIEIDSLSTGAYNNIGTIFLDYLNDLEKAENYLMKGYEIDNDHIILNYNLARLYNQKEEYTKSIEYYLKAIELYPENGDYNYYLANVFKELGRYEEAEKNYLKAIEKDPRENNFRDDLITLYIDHLKIIEKAIDLINQGIKVNSEWERYFTKRLAEIQFENLNDNQQALKSINKALKKVEESENYASSYYELRGKIFQSLNKLESAEDDYKKSISLDATEVNHYFNLANFYISTSQLEKAEEMILETIDLSRNDPDGFYKLYTIELIKKNNFKALEFLTVSIQKYEDSLLNEEEYYISDFDNLNRVELEDLYIKRAELKLNLIGTNNSSCEDLNYALKISGDESKKEMIEEKILVSCSN